MQSAEILITKVCTNQDKTHYGFGFIKDINEGAYIPTSVASLVGDRMQPGVILEGYITENHNNKKSQVPWVVTFLPPPDGYEDVPESDVEPTLDAPTPKDVLAHIKDIDGAVSARTIADRFGQDIQWASNMLSNLLRAKRVARISLQREPIQARASAVIYCDPAIANDLMEELIYVED